MGGRKQSWHMGPHQVTARRVVAAANAQPDYRCPTCHLTLAEGVARWGVNGQWEAGHREHGRSDLGYWAEHVHCNRANGARLVNAKRAEPHSREW